MPRLSTGVLLGLTFVPAALLSMLTISAFLHEIPRFSSGTQENYVIDGYYYYYLGQSAVTMAQTDQVSLLEAATELRPNVESTGAVYLSALLARILPSIYLVALALLTAYWVAFALLLNTRRVSSTILLLPLSGLMPYVFIPSKEAFLVLGILLTILAYLDRRFLILGAAGVVLVYLARPDAAYVLLLSCFLASLDRFRWLLAGVLLSGVAAYFWWLRPAASLFAGFEQSQAFMMNTGFCNLGPFSVCVGADRLSEVVYVERILSLLGLPFKWIWEGCTVFFAGVTLPNMIIRIALVVQIAWVWWVLSKRTPSDARAAMVRHVAAWFGGIYLLLYGALVYFQSTRQLVFITSIVATGWCVHLKAATETSKTSQPLERTESFRLDGGGTSARVCRPVRQGEGRGVSLGIFVNTSDGFQDCWPPFFELFRRYGGSLCSLPVYLNTERAEFADTRGSIYCTKTWAETEVNRPSWSQCLRRGLDLVQEDYVLYLQEDYFFKCPVPEKLLEDARTILDADAKIGVVYLTPKGPRIQKAAPYSEMFVEICPPADYLVSTQAALWRRDYLRSLVRDWENGWMFEKFGSLRALRSPRRMLSVSQRAIENGEFLDYVWTGVMKGKWNAECVELFREHHIEMDFERRGFYEEGSRLKSRLEVLKKLFGQPWPALRSVFDLMMGARTGSASRG